MKKEKGFGLVEVLMALVLLGIIAIAFLGALATGSKALFIADERATAESLARSQMEYVKNLDYIIATAYNPGPPPSGGEAIYVNAKISVPSGYEIRSINRAGGEDTSTNIIGVPWNGQLTPPPEGQAVDTDAGLQRIKLVIYHLDKNLFELADYKVER